MKDPVLDGWLLFFKVGIVGSLILFQVLCIYLDIDDLPDREEFLRKFVDDFWCWEDKHK